MSPDLTRRDLESLPDYHVACRLLSRGRTVAPFVFSTLPGKVQPPTVRADVLATVEANYVRHTRLVSEVEAEIRAERARPQQGAI